MIGFKGWHQPAQYQKQERQCSAEEARIGAILETAGIAIDGPRLWDIQVHNPRFYRRLLADGTLGLGESYMDGWWDTAAVLSNTR